MVLPSVEIGARPSKRAEREEPPTMKRTTVLATSLVLAGSILLPTAAAADPWVSATSNGVDVDGTTGSPGLPIRIEGTGCDNAGGTAVMGLFVSPAGDPWARPIGEELIQIEHPVDAQGAFTWDLVIEDENDTGTFTNRWYCATEPVTAMRDAAVTWVSPPASMTIEDGGPIAGGAGAAVRMVAAKATAPAAAPTVRITMDPESLPAVDEVGIQGPVAARLKDRVDDRAELNGALSRLVNWLFGRKPVAAKPTSEEYVAAAFQTVAGRAPSSRAMALYVERLEAGELKVQVVEDIALTQASASWWNRR
jgi:hypothetical protein